MVFHKNNIVVLQYLLNVVILFKTAFTLIFYMLKIDQKVHIFENREEIFQKKLATLCKESIEAKCILYICVY